MGFTLAVTFRALPRESNEARAVLPRTTGRPASPTLHFLPPFFLSFFSAFLRFFYPARHTTDPNGADVVQAAAVIELTTLRDETAKQLGSGPFLLGSTFTVADIYLAMLSSWGTELEGAAGWWANPSLAAHYDAVLARPGCRKAVEDEGGSLSAR